jgi:hypothetical protein
MSALVWLVATAFFLAVKWLLSFLTRERRDGTTDFATLNWPRVRIVIHRTRIGNVRRGEENARVEYVNWDRQHPEPKKCRTNLKEDPPGHLAEMKTIHPKRIKLKCSIPMTAISCAIALKDRRKSTPTRHVSKTKDNPADNVARISHVENGSDGHF